MWSLYRTLSLRDLARRWLRTLLIALCIGLGVSTVVATQALNASMAYAAVFSSNPTSGFADLVVSNGELPVSLALEQELAKVPGVKSVKPRVFANALLPELGDHPVLVVGVDFQRELEDVKSQDPNDSLQVSAETKQRFKELYLASRKAKPDDDLWKRLVTRAIKALVKASPPPVLVGRQLFDSLPPDAKKLVVQNGKASKPREHAIAGPVDASGRAASLAGYVIGMDLSDAQQLFDLGETNQINRFDVSVTQGTSVAEVRKALEATLKGRAEVRTFDEQILTTRNVMDSMQVGFSLCGLATLVVGLFLVFNTLSVTVTERRHEIGILHSLGATRRQILFFFVGEAFLLGLIGSLIGLPIGWVLARLGLGPMQRIVSGILVDVNAATLHISWKLYVLGLVGGVVTTMLAALIPALSASRENPSEAIRKLPKAASVTRLAAQIMASVLLVGLGSAMILERAHLPPHVGTLGGASFVLVGGLVATPFFTAILARMLQPFVRRLLGIEWRLGIDNIVRAPGRTGLVIGALAAGVALVVQTAGVIRSNRVTIDAWVEDAIGADMVVSAGSPVGASGTHPIGPGLVAEIRKFPEIDEVLPARIRKVPYRSTQVLLLTAEPGRPRDDQPRHSARRDVAVMMQRMASTPNGVVVSDNFATLHKVGVGDVVTLASPKGEVRLTILGAVSDYSWNQGTLFLNQRDYLTHWNDMQADVLHVYLRPGADILAAQKKLLERFGGTHGLIALTRTELHQHIDNMIESIYGIAYAQLAVVIVVAGLGVVTSLLIAVLQRRHEMGLLRAVGASRGHVIYAVLAEACWMGLIGTAIGVAVGVPLQWYTLNVVLPDEAGFSFPVYVPWGEALMVAAAAVATATIAGLGPAFHAVRQRIPEAIAYE
jgi:putative ABC transport system permease protein